MNKRVNEWASLLVSKWHAKQPQRGCSNLHNSWNMPVFQSHHTLINTDNHHSVNFSQEVFDILLWNPWVPTALTIYILSQTWNLMNSYSHFASHIERAFYINQLQIMINCFLKVIYVKHSDCQAPLLGTPTSSPHASLAMAGWLSGQEIGRRMDWTSSCNRVRYLAFLLILTMDMLYKPEQVTCLLCSLTFHLKW